MVRMDLAVGTMPFFGFSCSWPPCEGNKLFAER